MRTLLSTLVLALVSSFAFAQTSIGFRGGYGSSNLRADSELDIVADQFDNASTMSFGVFTDIPLGHVLSFRPGLELNRRGTSLIIDGRTNRSLASTFRLARRRRHVLATLICPYSCKPPCQRREL